MDGSFSTEINAPTETNEWIFFKLYLGKMANRMDRAILSAQAAISAQPGIDAWFYIRYVDEGGIHIRVRVRPSVGFHRVVLDNLRREFAGLLNRLHEFVPSDYFPMVSTDGFEEQLELTMAAHDDVRIVESVYEPELQKYGGQAGIGIAESVFACSSDIACAILDAEIKGSCSRKSLVPRLMDECRRAFLPASSGAEFWREYGYYWLNGRSPAAEDWRETFFAKSDQLREDNIALLDPEQQGAPAIAEQVETWRYALAQSAKEYLTVSDAEPEVLCFNIAHLMNNRLGIAALEESYMATLLERAAR